MYTSNSKKLFELKTFMRLISISELTLLHERERLKHIQNNTYIKLHHYVEDIKGFYPYIDELVSDVFKFKEEDTNEARRRYKALRPELKTMVSVHIRLTDYKKVASYFPSDSSQQSYFKSALSYFHNKYKVRFGDNRTVVNLNCLCIESYFFSQYFIFL